jgi:hypothetical protein
MSGDGWPGPTDSWVTLAGLARETSTIRLGTMVTSATFRHPGPLAISVAQVDAMNGGRVDSASAPAGLRRNTRPPPSPSRRWVNGSTDTTNNSTSSPGCGQHPSAKHSTTRALTTRSAIHPHCPNRYSSPTPHHHRRPGRQADPRAGGQVRHRIQRRNLTAGHRDDTVRPGPRRRRRRRPPRGLDDLLGVIPNVRGPQRRRDFPPR